MAPRELSMHKPCKNPQLSTSARDKGPKPSPRSSPQAKAQSFVYKEGVKPPVKSMSSDRIKTGSEVYQDESHSDEGWLRPAMGVWNSFRETQSSIGNSANVEGSTKSLSDGYSACLYQLRTSANEALKPYLMEMIDCMDGVNFDNDLNKALRMDEVVKKRAGFTLLEREKLLASDVLKYQDLYPALILKLIIWFDISRRANAAEWVRYQVENYYGSDSVTDTLKKEVEKGIFKIFQWLDCCDKEKEKIFEIRSYSDIDVVAIMDLITFFNEKHGYKDEYPDKIENEDQQRIELKQHLLKAIEMEESFSKDESDVDVQLRKILPKYTYLRASNKRGLVGAELMPNILIKNLVRCKDLDNEASKMVGPYFAWKILNERTLELLDDATFDQPEWYGRKLGCLPDASPSDLRSPKKWLDSAVLINALCQYYDFVRGKQSFQESEFKEHKRNIALLLKKLGLENQPCQTESTAREMLFESVMNIVGVLTQNSNLTVDEEKGARQGGVSSNKLKSGKDFRALKIRKIAEDYYKVSRYDDALELHEEVLGMLIESKNFGEAAVSRYHVALCHWNLGNRVKALENFEKASRNCNGQVPPSFKSKVAIAYASVLMHEGKLDKAMMQLSKDAVERDWRYHFALGSLNLNRSKYDRAIQDFKDALNWLEKEKNLQSLSFELVLSAMATVYLKKDKLAEAQSEYQKIFDRMKLKNLAYCSVQQIEGMWYSLEYALKDLEFENEAMQIHEKLSEVLSPRVR